VPETVNLVMSGYGRGRRNQTRKPFIKKILASAAAISLLSTASFAGNLVVPEMEPMVEVMQADTGSSSASGLIVPLLALIAIGLLISSNGNDTPTG